MNIKHLKKSIKENREVLEELKNILLVILIIIDLAMIFVVSIGDVSLNIIVFTAYFDLFVCVCLFFNLLVIYKKSDKRPWEFIKTHIIDILSILPLNFILFRYFTVVRLFKLVKLIPLFQVIRLQNLKIFNKGSLSYFVQNRLLKVLTIIIVFYTLISTYVLYHIDPNLHTFFEALWFNIATLTAVGYGDITPVEFPGQIIALISIVAGVFFISIFTAAMSALYMKQPETETRNIIKDNRDTIHENHEYVQDRFQQLESDIDDINMKLDYLIEIMQNQEKIENQDKIVNNEDKDIKYSNKTKDNGDDQ
ncbi:MAG: potassium channel family protein [Methanosphaera sp.]|uniref:potassium channel family protein n=1 Tax=Methanosphaera sp. TaxID=2666342 RepID=UPI0025FDDA47|nr:potassium channel family protein [Methanosphaera sp.]MCI5867111.1 potassium channel family protein [Methanosphaera sp.]MDD6535183.1 potassium channel family protein [Methanosphaera sp.]MDY3956503.1 potassium channel family protein [Methanosphaera sp.]